MWPSGQSRLKQGLHESLSEITRACADSGGVKRGARGAEERGHGPVERRGDVHEARVVADHVRRAATAGRSPRRARCGPARSTHAPPVSLLDLGGDLGILRRSRRATPGSRARASSSRERGEVLARASASRGRTPRPARTRRRAARASRPNFASVASRAAASTARRGSGTGRRSASPRGLRERGEALDHQRQRLLRRGVRMSFSSP